MVNFLYWKFNKVVSKELCDFFLKSFCWDNSDKGLMVGNKKENKIRKSDILFLDENNPLGCINFYHGLIANINAGWNFNLYLQEKTQIARYKNNGHYDWHMDTYAPENDLQRKITVITLLNDSKEFEGGQFLIKNCQDQPKLEQGDILVFPSYLEHKITPVTKGIRYSAVNWINGLSFR